MDKIKTIIEKEWAEVFKNRLVLFTVIFLPLFFTALSLIVLVLVGGADSTEAAMDTADMPEQFARGVCQGIAGGDCLQVFIGSQFMVMFMLLPVLIPVTIASYSIVGEKTTRSLEALLATPITTVQLLIGKGLAAAIPAVVATWLGFAIYMVGAALVSNSSVFGRLFGSLWLLAILVLGPLLAVLAVTLAVMVSSRVSDPRVAEQLSAVVVIPIILFMMGQMAGFIVLNTQIILLLVPIFVAIDAGLTYLAVKTFERENILTRWK